MKKIAFLFMALIMCLTLCACGKSTGIKESQILSDIPGQFLTVDGQPLNYDSIEVSKRNTEEGVDNIYFTLAASNSDYEVTAQCYFQYNYYSEGGWILDYAEIVNGEYTVTPLNGYSSDSAEECMQYLYMDYELISSDFGMDGESYYTEYVYEGTNEWTYYSQTVSEKFLHTFEPELEAPENPEDICCYNILPDWDWNRDSEIISDYWDLALDMYLDVPYDNNISVGLSVAFDEEMEGEPYLKYDGYFYDSDFLFSDLEYAGTGTTEYEVNYEDKYDPYVYFSATLYWVSDDGTLSSDTHKIKVKVKKDCVYMNDGFASNWYEVEDVS